VPCWKTQIKTKRLPQATYRLHKVSTSVASIWSSSGLHITARGSLRGGILSAKVVWGNKSGGLDVVRDRHAGATPGIDTYCGLVVGLDILRLSAMSATPRATATVSRFRRNSQIKPRSLSANVRRGAVWSIAGTIILRFSSVITTAIVAHILTPHDFGVFAVALTVFTIVTALGEFGVASCLARADLDAESLAPTLWSVSIASSLLIAGALYEFASPIAAGLGSPDAAQSVKIMSIVLLIWGVSGVPTGQCLRDFRADVFFWADVLSFFPGMLVLLFLAKHGDGATAFAWSRVAGQGTSCAVVLISVPKLHRPGLARSALSVLYRFGVPIAFANLISNVLQNVDYALISRLLGPVLLGAYVLAFNAASWSMGLLAGVLNNVALPAFSRVKDDAVRLRAAMVDGIRVVMLIAAPMCLIAMVLARPLVITLYGSRWASSATVLSILSCYGLISVAGVLFSNMLAALGRSRLVLGVQLIWLLGLVPAMVIGVREDGIVGAAIAHILIIGPVVLPCYLIALKRATGIRVSLLAKAAFPSLAVGAAAACLAWFAASRFENPVLQLTVGAAVGGSFYAVVMVPQLILLVTRGRTIPPRVNRILVTYYRAGRTLGVTMGPPPRHAVGRERHGMAKRRATRNGDNIAPLSNQIRKG
jgi:lipopolysaccharide exporter